MLFARSSQGIATWCQIRYCLDQFPRKILFANRSTLVQAEPKLDPNINQETENAVTPKRVIPNPLHYPDFFNLKNSFTVKDLFDARVHYGHTMGTLNDHMRQFILGHRLGTLIIDLDQTAPLLQEALNFIAHIAFKQGIILFVGRTKQLSQLIEKTAIECGEYSHTRFWYLGTFTDTKKLGAMTRLPDLTIIFNTLDAVFETHRAVLESNKLLIPSVAIVDTNCFPNYITYPIPGNDDSIESVELYCKLFKTAVLAGKAKRKEYEEKYGPNFDIELNQQNAKAE